MRQRKTMTNNQVSERILDRTYDAFMMAERYTCDPYELGRVRWYLAEVLDNLHNWLDDNGLIDPTYLEGEDDD